MLKKGILLIGISSFVFSSCIDHEVIPPPEPTVDLYAHFYGEVNGAPVEFTENVLGYANNTTAAKLILAAPSNSEAVYFAEMSSIQIATSVKVGIGSALWNSSLSAEPTLATFNTFFQSNLFPNYSDNGANGFVAVYRDGTGREWESSQNSTNVQNVEFTGILQESDNNGDYSKFICDFDCWMYSLHPDSLALVPPVVQLDSLHMLNATYEGWFQR
jgi:hypothetical protein